MTCRVSYSIDKNIFNNGELSRTYRPRRWPLLSYGIIRKTKGLTREFLAQFTDKQLDDYLERLNG